MKMNLSAEELSQFENLSDAELVKVIRSSLAAFRGSGGEEAEDDADVGGLAHSNANPQPSMDATTSAADSAYWRPISARVSAQSRRDREAERLIPNLRRLP